MKLICIGDSLTFGYGVHLSQRWTRLCAQETGWELVNEGINGDTTGGMLARMQGGVLAELREGGLGAEAISRIINHPLLRRLPFYLETPNDLRGYAKEISLLRSLCAEEP